MTSPVVAGSVVAGAVVVVASDLDRTLIFSRRSGGHTGVAVKDVETYRDAPISFVTPRAHDDLAALAASGRFVPVTTRTVEQYRRIRLPGPTPPLALCANGGRLLVDGVEDEAWSRRASSSASSSGEPFGAVWEWFAAACLDAAGEPHAFVSSFRAVEDLFVYAVAHEAWPQSWIDEVGARVLQAGWSFSVQGRKVYAVPSGLSKGAGVTALRELRPDVFGDGSGTATLVTAGDSWLDRTLLEVGDVAWTPRGSELHRAGFSLATLRVTAEEGFAAGEELASAFASAVCGLRS
ncbi:HAD family hydrolase [Nocardioides yefusunii]|uniref:HAD family hydrolase n=1 Tax=Nocardioides yefusunii TaxID=2500546 RepID=A0ABW1QYQ7_9ACTN|nr:HAD family hydrolase [Nocardioides yefusunii]